MEIQIIEAYKEWHKSRCLRYPNSTQIDNFTQYYIPRIKSLINKKGYDPKIAIERTFN
ncbi:hypothetical protein [Tepidibacter hydrothermalis]|uniref:Uncharacterized protein n=1 Tax=Tepidibacter hydrothermalis TaxID=3036126 RepID=A0ABY8E9Y3_9FIRM|nr:hypothetical protein [Tepidibacter hydrothermalis]WFD08740.1 hypothetical protein P4S50_10055 [Tepidibacter hydrothermalis]